MSEEIEKAWFGQENVHCRLEWGRRGALACRRTRGYFCCCGRAVVFYSCRDCGGDGAVIYPCGKDEDAGALARQWGAVMAVRREEVPLRGRYSLSPETFLTASPGERIVLQSPNGATCARYGNHVPLLLVGTLVNAASTASAVAHPASKTEMPVTILACGERWHPPHDEGELRFALEDYLGAGAILVHLPPSLTRSPEAMICESAFAAAADRLPQILRSCGSGIELADRGYPGDTDHAARLNVYTAVTAVPVLRDGVSLSGQSGRT